MFHSIGIVIDSTSAAKMNVTLYDGNQAVKNSSYLTLHNYNINIAYSYYIILNHYIACLL